MSEIANAITRLGNVLAAMDTLTTSSRKDRLIATGVENTISEVIQTLRAAENARKEKTDGESGT